MAMAPHDRDAQVLRHAQARKDVGDLERARQAAAVDDMRHQPRDRLTVEEDMARVRYVVAGDQVEEGRLARPVRADQPVALTALHGEIDPADDRGRPERLVSSRSTRTGRRGRGALPASRGAPGSTPRRVRRRRHRQQSGAQPGSNIGIAQVQEPSGSNLRPNSGYGTARALRPPQHRVGIRHHDVDALDREYDADSAADRPPGREDMAGPGAAALARSRRACREISRRYLPARTA